MTSCRSCPSPIIESVKFNMDNEPLYRSMTDIISDLSKPNGFLTKYERNQKKYEEIQYKLFRVKNVDNMEQIESRYPYCHIQPARSVKQLTATQIRSFEMDYRLFIHHRTDLYYAKFTASYIQIQKLLEIAHKTREYFPSTCSTTFTYPTGIYVFKLHENVDANILSI